MTNKINPFKEPPPEWLPDIAVVQASGSSYCPDPAESQSGELGTLGVRVSQSPDVAYMFVATSHQFPNNSTTYQLLYYNPESGLSIGPTGRVIGRKYELGPGKVPLPLLDCGLIKLNSTTPKDVTSGVFQGAGKPLRAIKGKGFATPGTLVNKFGMKTGLTYGLTLPLYTELDQKYDPFLFLIELCNESGHPMCGDFCDEGDSGAPIIDKNGYVLGILIGDLGMLTGGALTEPGSRIGVATRFDKIEAALGVTLSPQA